MLIKINGPLIRIKNDLKVIQDGNFATDIILRRKDEFADVAAALNDMLTRLRQRFGEFKTGYNEISRALMDLEVDHAKGMPIGPEAKRIAEMVRMLQKKTRPIPEE